MKVLLINTYPYGGAGKACIRLHKGLLKIGIDSHILFAHGSNETIPQSSKFEKRQTNFALLQKIHDTLYKIVRKVNFIAPIAIGKTKEQFFLEQRSSSLEMFSFPFAKTDITDNPLYKEADIIHLHWVAEFLDYPSFFAKNKKPIVWTLHDESPFESGEHYTEQFDNISENGKPLKRVYSELELKWQEKISTLKKNIFNNTENIFVVSPSRWLCNISKESSVFSKYRHKVIPNGLDTSIFNLKSKEFCRQVFGLPLDKKIVLFVADRISNRRKGFVFLQKAIENLDKSDLIICAIGSTGQSYPRSYNLIETGRIDDERLMSILYSSGDVFVIPSLEDNLPNTVIESLCCGTPVIGFDSGGICDMVENGTNGYICKEISVQSLTETIKFFLDYNVSVDREEISKQACEKYKQEIQAEAYVQLYREIV